MAITFQTPPINEVVIGKVFEQRPDLTIPHYGRFWGLVEDDFPNCQHAAPVFDQNSGGPEGAVDPFTGAPLPRVWFVSRDATRLLQLQQDRFYFDWRQVFGQPPNEYIRFDSIFADYRKYSDVLSAFFLSQFEADIVPKRHDLTYVNILRKGVEWNQFSDLQNIFKGFDFVRAYGDVGPLLQASVRCEFKLRESPGKLTLHIAHAMNAATSEPVIRMELAASCAVSEMDGVKEDDWLRSAHDAIVQGFCEVTTDDAQKRYWKRIS